MKTFQAVAPDGTIFTRASDHEYTHAVLCELNDKDKEKSGRSYDYLSFNSSLALAGKSKQKYDNAIAKYGIGKTWNRVFIVDATQVSPAARATGRRGEKKDGRA